MEYFDYLVIILYKIVCTIHSCYFVSVGFMLLFLFVVKLVVLSLMSDSFFTCFQSMFKKCGGILNDCEGVNSIRPISDTEVEVITTKRSYRSKSVILTCGPYVNKLLKTVDLQLPIQV